MSFAFVCINYIKKKKTKKKKKKKKKKKNKKKNGPDGISATMLKSTAYSITPALTKLFNVINKILEHHMYWQIATHLKTYSPISIHQWGFQSKKSTNGALLDVYNTWTMEIDKGNEVCAI